MYLGDIKADFYEYLTGKRIFLMVNYDIDSICTCKILQTLLRHKHIIYTLVTVRGLKDLKRVYHENCEDVKHFILINCGGTIDIVEELEPEEDVVFFVLDAHRPIDLCNVYSNGQIRLLTSPEEDGNVPDFQDIFKEDESDEEGDGSDGDEDEAEESQSKRRRLGEEAILKRRERRLWEENRNRLLFEYTQFSYYSKASAIIMYNLAWKLNVDDKDLLWYAIVSLTEQYLLCKIENTDYILEVGNLQAHAARLANRSKDTSQTSLKLNFEKDLRLVLYRHWTVQAALKYSIYTACNMRLWSFRGDKKLQQLLVEMGLPLVQSQQAFRSMDLQLRNEFHEKLEKSAQTYNIEDIVYATFTLQYGYKHKFCAADVVYGLLGVLECATRDNRIEECFHRALDCLSRSKSEILYSGIESSKKIAIKLFKTVQNALDMKHVISAGPFLYYIVQEGCLDWHLYSQQHILSLLAQFVLKAYVATSKNRKAPTLPLIVSVPCDLEHGLCVLIGIPPVCENSPKNFFGKAFEQAAERTNCEGVGDYFDTSYFKLHAKHRTRFFDALTSLLS